MDRRDEDSSSVFRLRLFFCGFVDVYKECGCANWSGRVVVDLGSGVAGGDVSE